MNTIRTKLYAVVICISGTASIVVPSTSMQAAEQDPPSKTVRYGDLNIAETAGAKTLYSRILAAAQEVCDRSIGTDPILRAAMQACVKRATDNAVKKVDAPALSALRFGSKALRLANK
jgi:UrcA family protein